MTEICLAIFLLMVSTFLACCLYTIIKIDNEERNEIESLKIKVKKLEDEVQCWRDTCGEKEI